MNARLSRLAFVARIGRSSLQGVSNRVVSSGSARKG
jgi:hypothetical protein